ncbi:MAG TPA: fumarylacetoacetate hydrolase family protein [Polyangiaceae bacterium]|nr:fumarylacetoacetate hydrolase family protein [Polyangiaceae bacterium]
MRLATRDDGTRDGRLIVIDRQAEFYADAGNIVADLQSALDDWPRVEPQLQQLAHALHGGQRTGSVSSVKLLAPLPRAYEWVDGSAYLNHIALVRKARGAALPEDVRVAPLVYQGGSGVMLAHDADMELTDAGWGLDFEAEVCVILADTPQGTLAHEAASHIRLVMLANDITLRNLIPKELHKGFGFFCSKPATAFSPFAITVDELGSAWRDGRVHLPLRSSLDGALVGDPNAGEMHFSFHDLIAHITQTRSFTAGTILGGGTVSNVDPARGVSCLAERRAREIIEFGAARTPFLLPGNSVRIEMLAEDGSNLFGSIEQRVALPKHAVWEGTAP